MKLIARITIEVTVVLLLVTGITYAQSQTQQPQTFEEQTIYAVNDLDARVTKLEQFRVDHMRQHEIADLNQRYPNPPIRPPMDANGNYR
jgi:hypothetical protein